MAAAQTTVRLIAEEYGQESGMIQAALEAVPLFDGSSPVEDFLRVVFRLCKTTKINEEAVINEVINTRLTDRARQVFKYNKPNNLKGFAELLRQTFQKDRTYYSLNKQRGWMNQYKGETVQEFTTRWEDLHSKIMRLVILNKTPFHETSVSENLRCEALISGTHYEDGLLITVRNHIEFLKGPPTIDNWMNAAQDAETAILLEEETAALKKNATRKKRTAARKKKAAAREAAMLAEAIASENTIQKTTGYCEPEWEEPPEERYPILDEQQQQFYQNYEDDANVAIEETAGHYESDGDYTPEEPHPFFDKQDIYCEPEWDEWDNMPEECPFVDEQDDQQIYERYDNDDNLIDTDEYCDEPQIYYDDEPKFLNSYYEPEKQKEVIGFRSYCEPDMPTLVHDDSLANPSLAVTKNITLSARRSADEAELTRLIDAVVLAKAQRVADAKAAIEVKVVELNTEGQFNANILEQSFISKDTMSKEMDVDYPQETQKAAEAPARENAAGAIAREEFKAAAAEAEAAACIQATARNEATEVAARKGTTEPTAEEEAAAPAEAAERKEAVEFTARKMATESAARFEDTTCVKTRVEAVAPNIEFDEIVAFEVDAMWKEVTARVDAALREEAAAREQAAAQDDATVHETLENLGVGNIYNLISAQCATEFYRKQRVDECVLDACQSVGENALEASQSLAESAPESNLRKEQHGKDSVLDASQSVEESALESTLRREQRGKKSILVEGNTLRKELRVEALQGESVLDNGQHMYEITLCKDQEVEAEERAESCALRQENRMTPATPEETIHEKHAKKIKLAVKSEFMATKKPSARKRSARHKRPKVRWKMRMSNKTTLSTKRLAPSDKLVVPAGKAAAPQKQVVPEVDELAGTR